MEKEDLPIAEVISSDETDRKLGDRFVVKLDDGLMKRGNIIFYIQSDGHRVHEYICYREGAPMRFWTNNPNDWIEKGPSYKAAVTPITRDGCKVKIGKTYKHLYLYPTEVYHHVVVLGYTSGRYVLVHNLSDKDRLNIVESNMLIW